VRFRSRSTHARANVRGVRRIGFIIGNTTPSLIEAFRGALSSLGHVEGKNLFLDLRVASLEDMPKHAADLANSDLELMVAAALPWALEIRRANRAMPMVIATCPGMVSNGFARVSNIRAAM
jgi:hypothetical protein